MEKYIIETEQQVIIDGEKILLERNDLLIKNPDKNLLNESQYYYLSGNMGITPSGSFSNDKTRWMKFDQNEKDRMEQKGIKPYGATKKGTWYKITENSNLDEWGDYFVDDVETKIEPDEEQPPIEEWSGYLENVNLKENTFTTKRFNSDLTALYCNGMLNGFWYIGHNYVAFKYAKIWKNANYNVIGDWAENIFSPKKSRPAEMFLKKGGDKKELEQALKDSEDFDKHLVNEAKNKLKEEENKKEYPADDNYMWVLNVKNKSKPDDTFKPHGSPFDNEQKIKDKKSELEHDFDNKDKEYQIQKLRK